MLRRMIVALAIMASTIGVVGIAGAPAASAANCTIAVTGPVYSPHAGYNVIFSVQAYHCDHVDKVAFAQCPASPNPAAGITDATIGYKNACQQTAVVELVTNLCGGCGPPYDTGSFTYAYTYTQWCWYVGAVHNLSPYTQFKLHNDAFGGSWGNWTYKTAPYSNFAC